MTEHKVATTDEISEGDGKIVEVEGLSVAVFNVEGDYYAVTNRCIHKGGPLGEGFLHADLPTIDKDRKSIHCPWHFWEFDLETGRSIVHPETGIRAFNVRTSNGDVILQI